MCAFSLEQIIIFFQLSSSAVLIFLKRSYFLEEMCKIDEIVILSHVHCLPLSRIKMTEIQSLSLTYCNPFHLPSINQSINQSVSQSINQSINQSVNQSLSQSISQSVSQSISQSVSQSVSQSISQSINQSVSQSISQSISQSV